MIYHKDRLNNLVFLSLSLCTKRLSYSGKETQQDAVYKTTPSQDLASKIFDEINISCYTELQPLILH